MGRGSLADPKASPSVGRVNRDTAIAEVETIQLRLPYRSAVAFKTIRESTGEYVILRLALRDGLDGIAEAICRPKQSGEDAGLVAYQIATFFRTKLIGANALGHRDILADLDEVRF